MKCTNCGKNNAVAHYHFEMNGETHEAHLCAECARKLQPEREFAAKTHEVFGDMFDDGFFSGGLFGRRSLGSGMLRSFFGADPFEDFFGRALTASPFALFGMPRIEISFPEAEKSAATGSDGNGGSAGVDPELSRRREMNALREQMKKAAENEDYEKAAELKAKLNALENEGKKAE